MTYYLAGYYLIKQQPLSFGTEKDNVVSTCSSCINDSLIDAWAYSWTTKNNAHIDSVKLDFQIPVNTVAEIRHWVDQKFNENKIGWPNLFVDLETAHNYKQKFFSHLKDIKTYAIYFESSKANDLLDEFKPKGKKEGEIGLVQNLKMKIPEKIDNLEQLIGFDLIGIEVGGSFHSFHCHDIGKELSDKFGLTLNNFGLFDNKEDWKPSLDFLNDENNGCEPVPWFVVKTKLIKNE